MLEADLTNLKGKLKRGNYFVLWFQVFLQAEIQLRWAANTFPYISWCCEHRKSRERCFQASLSEWKKPRKNVTRAREIKVSRALISFACEIEYFRALALLNERKKKVSSFWILKYIFARISGKLNPRKWINKITENEIAYEIVIEHGEWKKRLSLSVGSYLSVSASIQSTQTSLHNFSLLHLFLCVRLYNVRLIHPDFRFDLVSFRLQDINNVAWNRYQ